MYLNILSFEAMLMEYAAVGKENDIVVHQYVLCITCLSIHTNSYHFSAKCLSSLRRSLGSNESNKLANGSKKHLVQTSQTPTASSHVAVQIF